jgi:outer membrane protein
MSHSNPVPTVEEVPVIRAAHRLLLSGLLAGSIVLPAPEALRAQEAEATAPAAEGERATTKPAAEKEKKKWQVRGRVVNVNPDDSSGAVTGIAGSGVRVDDDTGVDLDITYMAAEHFGIELAVAWAKLDIRGAGTIAGLGRIGTTRVTPITLMGQYHFQPAEKTRPYLGLGLTIANFHNERGSAVLDAALGGTTTLSLADRAGVTFQGGVDFEVGEDWFVNLDAKYSLIDSRMTATTGAVARAVTLELDPWVVGGGVGARF